MWLLLWFSHIIGPVESGLPEIKLPPMQTTIGDQTLYFTDMIQHVGSSVLALPLISILESIAVAKAFCKYISPFVYLLAQHDYEYEFYIHFFLVVFLFSFSFFENS